MHRALPLAVTVAAIRDRIGGEVHGDASRPIARLASLESAEADCITFLTGSRHARAARATRAAAVILPAANAADAPDGAVRLVVPDPYVAYAQLSRWFESLLAASGPPGAVPAVHPGASIDPQAHLGAGVEIGPGARIEAGASIGAGCRIGAGVSVGEGASIGAGSRLYPNVVVYGGVRIGARAILHAGAVVGADGFGFAPSARGFEKIAQLGTVVIGDDVEIGANSTVDRGALDDTVIGEGCKIDNQVQIGHNVRIGAHTVIAGCVGIAGSAVIGSRCMIGGGVGIAGHIEICDGAVIGGFSMVERSVTEPAFYTGAWPLQPHAQWERTAATLKQLPRLRQRLRALATLVGAPKDPS